MKRTALRRKHPMKRTGRLSSKKPGKKKQTKADLWRSYGLERPPKPRYTGRKGIYWYLLSIKVRQRDFKRFGVCIGCETKVDDWHSLQCGHFIAAMKCGFDLLFDERNNNGECGGCNAYDKQKFGYERNLDLRYGKGTAQKLKDRFFEHQKIGGSSKEWSQLEYDTKIRALVKYLKIKPIEILTDLGMKRDITY